MRKHFFFKVCIIGIICCRALCLSSQVAVDFTADVREGCEQVSVNFTDESIITGTTVVAWSWDLGIGSSNQQNPGVIYTEVGSYTVCLTITDILGIETTVCQEDYIIVHPNPTVDFAADISGGCTPLTVTYQDLTNSSSPIQSWQWDIGGSTNVIITEDQNQLIQTTYTEPGSFGATLIVRDENGCQSSLAMTNIVEVIEAPPLDIVFDIVSDCGYPQEIQFQLLALDNDADYSWIFGNGETSNGSNPPVISFNEGELISAQVFVQKEECIDSMLISNIISSEEPSISVSGLEGCVNTEFEFTLNGFSTWDSIVWNMGDGTILNEDMPIYSYQNAGCFEVYAIHYLSSCVDTVRFEPCIDILPEPEVSADFDLTDLCKIPVTLSFEAQSDTIGAHLWIMDTPSGRKLSTDSIGFRDFTEQGLYRLKYRFTSASGCEVERIFGTFEVGNIQVLLPEAGFEGCIPLVINPVDSVISQDPIVSWKWILGPPNEQIAFGETPSFTIQDTGQYDLTLIVENSAGCRDTVTYDDYVLAGIPPEVNFTATPLDECASEINMFFDASSDYADEWLWDFGDGDTSSQQNPSHFYIDTGFFNIQLTAYHNGCPDSLTIPQYIHIQAPISKFKVSYDCDDFFEIGVKDLSIGADSMYWFIEYSETNIDTVYFADSLTLNFPQRGNYVIGQYSYNFSNGCEYLRIDTIRVREPQAQFVLDTVRGCRPLQVFSTDLSIDAENYMYVAMGGDISQVDASEPTILYNTAGEYEAPIQIVTDIHGCSDTLQLLDNIFVNEVKAIPVYDSNVCVPGELRCLDQSTSLFGEINNWSWNIGGVFESQEQDPSFLVDQIGPFNLFLSVVDSWNCADSIAIPEAITTDEITLDFQLDTLSCTMRAVQFNNLSEVIRGDFIYQWDFGDGEIGQGENVSHVYQQEGSYTVCLQAISNNGCTAEICKQQVVEILNPIAQFAADETEAFCPPLVTNFTNSSTNAINYTWDFGDNTGISALEAPAHVYTIPGSYDVSLVAELVPGCADTLVFEDYINISGPVGEFRIESDSACLPLTISVIASSLDFYEYTWDFGDGSLVTTQSSSLTDTTFYVYDLVGTYTPKMILKDSLGCSRSFSGDPIPVHDIKMSFEAPDTLLCFQEEVGIPIKNSTVTTASYISFDWLAYGAVDSLSISPQPAFVYPGPGKYDIQLIAKAENCIDTLLKETEINLIDKVSVEAIGDSICHKDIATISGQGNAEKYVWIDTETNSSISGELTTQVSPRSTQMYQFIGSKNFCENDTSEVMVFVDEPLLVEFAEDYTVYNNLGVQIELVYDTTRNYSFHWFPSDGLSCDKCPNPKIDSLDWSKEYELLVIDEDTQCFLDKTLFVKFRNECTTNAFYVPNIFSPNGDNLNDTYRIFVHNEEEFRGLYIFDRWGELMFESEDITERWDGIFLGEPLQPAVFTVLIKLICPDTREHYYMYRTVTIVK